VTHASHPHFPDPAAFGTLGQRIVLDTLRAEMAALLVILPGIPTASPPETDLDAITDTAFDNMPV
jgi:hypothetical protein